MEVEDLDTGRAYTEAYDALVLSPGSRPIRPPLPGIDLPGIFTLWTIPDTRDIVGWIQDHGVKRAMVVGGGFIGLEMVENLVGLGIGVDLVEMAPHVMPSMDPEMAAFIHEHLKEKGVSLYLETAVTGFENSGANKLTAALASGQQIETEMVLMAVGVRPRTELAVDAGLEIGPTGGIRVSSTMATSDDHVWAVGDAVETVDAITAAAGQSPPGRAGPTDRDALPPMPSFPGSPAPHLPGVQATAVCGVCGLTVAATGLSEKAAARSMPTAPCRPLKRFISIPTTMPGIIPMPRPSP